MYNATTNSASTPMDAPRLCGDAAGLRDQLVEINDRLISLGDALLGPVPREAGGKANMPEPPPSMRLHMDRMATIVSEIRDNLTRIESRV